MILTWLEKSLENLTGNILYYVFMWRFCYCFKPLDIFNYRGISNPKARENLLEAMEYLQLFDYYKILNPDKKFIIGLRKTSKASYTCGLEYILISDSLSNLVENISIKPCNKSDHSTVIVEL